MHPSVRSALFSPLFKLFSRFFFQLAYVAAFLRCFHDTKTHDTMINDAFNAFILPEGEGRSPNAFQ